MKKLASVDGRSRQRRWRAPDPCLLAALGLALVAKVACALPRHVCFGDEACYLWLARNLFNGEGYTYYNGVPELHFPPLFPLVLALFNLLVNDWEVVSRVVYVVFATALIVPIYLLGRDIYGRATARIAAFMAALLPAFTSGVLFAETLSEPLYLFWLFFGLYWFYRVFETRSWSSHVLTGACLSLAYLTRPEAILQSTFAIALLVAVYALRRPLPLFGAAARVGTLVGAFLLPALPYLVFLHSHTGEWQLTTKSTTSYTTTRGLVHHDGAQFMRDTWGLTEGGEIRYYAHDFDSSLGALLLGPYRDRVLSDVRANAANAGGTLRKHTFFGQTLAFLALFGLIAAPWTRRRLGAEAFLMAMMLPLATFLVFFIKDRFLYPLLLPLTLWAAQGVRHVLEWVRKTEFPSFRGLPALRRAGEVAVVFVVLGYLAKTSRTVFVQRDRARQPDQWVVADALRAHTSADAKVLASLANLAFHADRKWLPLPVAPLADVLDYARRNGATHLVVNRTGLELRPAEQQALLEAPRSLPGLELVHVEPDVCAIYRIASSATPVPAVSGATLAKPAESSAVVEEPAQFELQRP